MLKDTRDDKCMHLCSYCPPAPRNKQQTQSALLLVCFLSTVKRLNILQKSEFKIHIFLSHVFDVALLCWFLNSRFKELPLLFYHCNSKWLYFAVPHKSTNNLPNASYNDIQHEAACLRYKLNSFFWLCKPN